MKFTYNWLKDFLALKVAPEALADKLTMAGIEVKAIEERDGDYVFEIEITSNRPDWLSVLGVAREAAALTHAGIKNAVKKQAALPKKDARFVVRVENSADCPLYTACIIRDCKVGASPDWLKKRLESIGCRSVNNIVDITNYVMYELGEPLHAFDLDRLSSQDMIMVRRAKPGEKLFTIDGVNRELSGHILVIADKGRPVALAGVMGGKDTEVGPLTKNILLEAAIFNPVLVRSGRRKLGMSSDSSYRFERGLDIQTALAAQARAVTLIAELSGGKAASFNASGSLAAKKKSVNLGLLHCEKVLGLKVPPDEIKRGLSSLGFKVKAKGKNTFIIEVPGFRQDVSSEMDIVEEVIRIYGYERAPSSLPVMKPQVASLSRRSRLMELKNILVSLNLQEAITHSLVDRAWVSEFLAPGTDLAEVENPLSQEQAVLRPTMIPSLLRSLAVNLNQKQEYVALFEAADNFSRQKNTINQELNLAMLLCGTDSRLFNEGRIRDAVSLLNVKGIIEELANRLGIKLLEFKPIDSKNVGILIGNQPVGALFQVAPSVCERFEIKNRPVFAAEFKLEPFFAAASNKKAFRSLPVFPAITRDLSIVLKEGVILEEAFALIRRIAGTLLEKVEVSDYYRGKQIPAGYRGITISCTYRSGERTLTEGEIAPLQEAIAQSLAKELGASLR